MCRGGLTWCREWAILLPMKQLSEGQKAAGREARRARRALRLTQKDVANLAGVHWKTVGRFENGEHWPRGVAEISRAVGKPYEYLEEYAYQEDRRRASGAPMDPRIAKILIEIDALEELQRQQLLDQAHERYESVDTGE